MVLGAWDWQGVVVGVGIFSECHKRLDFFPFQDGDAMFRLSGVTIVHEIVQRLRDVFCQGRLDGQSGVTGANQKGKGRRMDDTIITRIDRLVSNGI
jgi:hypothetical protein